MRFINGDQVTSQINPKLPYPSSNAAVRGQGRGVAGEGAGGGTVWENGRSH